MRRLHLVSLAACGAALLLAPHASAATFTVNSTADDPASGATNNNQCDSDLNPNTLTCTLRAAIQESNADFGSDVIQLPNLGSPYVLDEGPAGDDLALNGDLDVHRTLTLQGSGQPAIDAMGLDRVFHIGPTATAPLLTISGVEIRGGTGVAQGGGLMVETGTLAMTSVTVTGNSASTGNAQGGGVWIDSGGNHTITASTISGNQATGVAGAAGGGLGLGGAGIAIVNSTISGNTAAGGAGAGEGGGIWSQGSVSLTHASMVQNDATGIAPEGGTVYTQAGAVSFRATVLDQGDAGPGTENCESGGGSLISLGANLEALDSGAGLQCGLTSGAGDLFVLTSGLTPLAHRGGPTQTHALFNGSPALDAIPSCFPIGTDQRGEPRPGAFACDIGSFERQVRAPPGEQCFGREPSIIGFADSEKIVGTPEADVIVSAAGNDVIRSGEGNDRVCAGKGKDRILGGGGNDRLAGEESNDRIFGNEGDDLLRGVSGRDFLAGGKGRDRLDGGKAKDRCRATGGDKLKSC